MIFFMMSEIVCLNNAKIVYPAGRCNMTGTAPAYQNIFAALANVRRAFCEAVPAEYDTGVGNIELQSGCIIRKIIISLPRKRKDAGVVELARLESE